MEKKLPYYMAYPMPLLYDDTSIEQRDFEYMKSMYPDLAKKLLCYVEDECDRMTYENSMIFDEYPDMVQIHLMCKRICDRVEQEIEEDHKIVQQFVQLMMLHEINKRRHERRTLRRNFYI